MYQRLPLICLYFLNIFVVHSSLRAYATAISPGAQYSNASDLILSQTLESPFPYDFPDERDPDNLFPMPECEGLVLEEATVDFLQHAMETGQLTSTSIALCYLQRIYQTNSYTK